ncbi:glycosyltransferase family 9 protein [Gillisia mitskevichiae]|uniref:glycosyltransferase family 9 protein n=1 Tax=Gillisia mitskevichiae TaxID=270921 RepID=UPI000EB3BD14|nr:glycosyltransferase family 9 protein [Gillisia mitskevichiae]
MSRKTIISKSSKDKSNLHPSKGEHILVIRLSALGDVAMLVPVLRVVTATYPQLKITLLTRAFFAPIFKDNPNISIYEADINGVHSGVFGLSRLAKDLRDLEIDAVADMHDVLRSNVLKSIFYFYGIPVKQIDKGRSEKKALTAANNKVFIQLKATHQRYADVFNELGYPIDLRLHKFPEKQKISPNTREITGTDPLKWIGVAPFAQHNSKVYPLDLMDKVLAQLNSAGKIQIFLFGGGKKEAAMLEELAAKYDRVKSLAGKLKFDEELALISNLDAMLSMDSGNAHLAAMYGVPVVTLWGVTHPYTGFKPFEQPLENCILPDLNKYPQIPTSIYGNKVPDGYEDVMRTISPDTVVVKINSVLNIT